METAAVTETVASIEVDEYDATETSRLLNGDHSSLTVPSNWIVDTSEVWKGTAADGYYDTTVRREADPNVMMRVDVNPGPYTAAATAAAGVERYLVRQRGYRRLTFAPTAFAGYEAFRWDFIVLERGVLLRKSDIFFTTNAGDAYAVLIQAPASRYGVEIGGLEEIRRSLTVGPSSSDATAVDVPSVDESEFCETHDCIDYFDEGIGTIVQCRDGMWSHSGGRPGACSHHGGVAGGSSGYSSGSSGADTNGDGSTYNWCGATRDGDGDGLWCEGR